MLWGARHRATSEMRKVGALADERGAATKVERLEKLEDRLRAEFERGPGASLRGGVLEGR